MGSIDAELTFDEVQYLLIMKNLYKLGIEWMQLNTIKVSLDNPLACITLSAGTLKYFLNNQEYKNIRKISTSLLFYIVLISMQVLYLT